MAWLDNLTYFTLKQNTCSINLFPILFFTNAQVRVYKLHENVDNEGNSLQPSI